MPKVRIINTTTKLRVLLPLVQRAFAWNRERCDADCLELVRFLLIKAVANDLDGTEVSPSPRVDQLWHELILDTTAWSAVVRKLGVWIAHVPARSADADWVKRRRYEKTLETYSAVFNKEAPAKYWPADYLAEASIDRRGCHVIIVKPDGHKLEVSCELGDTIEEIKKKVYDRTGIYTDHQRLAYKGKQMDDGRALYDYGIKSADELNMWLRLRGC